MRDELELFLESEPVLAARSILLSTLLGSDPPELPVARLIQIAGLFGCSEGTVRTAVTRMTHRGELVVAAPARYRLGDDFTVRYRRQLQSRSAATLDWSGTWRMAVTTPDTRSQRERRQLRDDLRTLRLGRLRDGVYLRPDNLADSPLGESRRRIDQVSTWMNVTPDEDAQLAAGLWDLDGWIERATTLRRLVQPLAQRLTAGDTAMLGPGFVVSAAVLRHFQADPLLPRELWPRRWNGEALRRDYDKFDAAYRSVLRQWWRSFAVERSDLASDATMP